MVIKSNRRNCNIVFHLINKIGRIIENISERIKRLLSIGIPMGGQGKNLLAQLTGKLNSCLGKCSQGMLYDVIVHPSQEALMRILEIQ